MRINRRNKDVKNTLGRFQQTRGSQTHFTTVSIKGVLAHSAFYSFFGDCFRYHYRKPPSEHQIELQQQLNKYNLN